MSSYNLITIQISLWHSPLRDNVKISPTVSLVICLTYHFLIILSIINPQISPVFCNRFLQNWCTDIDNIVSLSIYMRLHFGSLSPSIWKVDLLWHTPTSEEPSEKRGFLSLLPVDKSSQTILVAPEISTWHLTWDIYLLNPKTTLNPGLETS